MKPIIELENDIVELELSVGGPFRFHGKIAGRVRVIHGRLSGETSVWVGDFCFRPDTLVVPDKLDDRPGAWKIYFAEARQDF